MRIIFYLSFLFFYFITVTIVLFSLGPKNLTRHRFITIVNPRASVLLTYEQQECPVYS